MSNVRQIRDGCAPTPSAGRSSVAPRPPIRGTVNDQRRYSSWEAYLAARTDAEARGDVKERQELPTHEVTLLKNGDRLLSPPRATAPAPAS